MIKNSEYIGKRIREQRILMEMTQAELANSSDFSPQYICQLENGSRQASLSALLRISEALDLSLDELLYGVQDSPHEYEDDISFLLRDCNQYERRVIYETVYSLKSILKNNSKLSDK